MLLTKRGHIMKRWQSKREDEFSRRTQELVSKLTLDEKLKLLTTHHFPVERLGMNEFYIGTEVARGYVGRSADKPSTVFPQPVGLASAFDRELMEKLDEIAADEARAYYNKDKKGGLALWGPTVDMERDPRWGRTEEAYGEDVCLAGELTAAYTAGMAGNDESFIKTIPTLKHFCANNNEKDRGTSDSNMPLRLKYEYYYAAFREAVKYGGARSLMAAYNDINGIPAICNPELSTVVKDDWGLWFAVSDGGDFSQTVTAHKYCASHAESLALTLKAGCDTMTDDADLTEAAARKALAEGLITEQDIDRSLYNTLFARHCLGQFDDCPFDSIDESVIDCEKHRQINRRAALEQVVLLKNSGILPLKEAPRKIAVTGALADESLMDWYTGYSTESISVRQGIEAEFPESTVIYDSLWDIVSIKASNGKYFSAKENGDIIADADAVTDSELFELQDWGEGWKNLFSVKYKKYVRFCDNCLKLHNRTIYDWFTRETFFIKDYLGKSLIEEYLFGQRIQCGENGMLSNLKQSAVSENMLFTVTVESSGADRAAEIAEKCDFVLYCTGNYPVQSAKECFDRTTLEMNVQKGMAETLYNANPNTVMTIISSYPYAVCRENEILPAILYTTHAGAYLGTAVAETLRGRNNPAARLPMTWYRSEKDLPDILSYDIESAGTTYMYFKGTPLYPFGHGLSYSSFEYSDLEVWRTGEGAAAEMKITNTSDIDGDEVVQIYFRVKNSAVSRPLKKLCGFLRCHIKAGETETVLVDIPEDILQIYDVRTGRFITETGEYVFSACRSSAEPVLEQTLEIDGEHLGLRPRRFGAETFDSAQNIKIRWSKALGRHFISACGWSGEAVYGGIPLENKSTLEIKAQSVFKKTVLTVKSGENTVEIPLGTNDGYDDFTLYTADISDFTGESLAVALQEGVSLLEIVLK
ncbi:MAG: glycoside hydrolase family 3 C-terminal domain-containing protein [Oscillospiraceae bacterium]|nr:glycoside hydrolase family 3 C-terminal domain-containing protein [Oscillospiraceae bacterium]